MQVYNKVYETPLEFFQFCKANALPSHSSHERERSRTEFTGTQSFEEAVSLIDKGWEPSKMKSMSNRITLRSVKQRMKLKRDNYGGTLLIDRYTQGLDKSFRRKYRSPKEDKHVTIAIEINETGNMTINQIFLKACVVSSIVENLRLQNVSCSIYGYFAIADVGDKFGLSEVVPIKRRNEKLQLYKLGAMLHPSCFRRLYFGRLENGSKASDNPISHMENFVFGGSYGCANSTLSAKTKSLVSEVARDERVLYIPQIRLAKFSLHDEEDAAKWVNDFVQTANAMFNE